MKTACEILAIVDFLGEELTDEQARRLMDETKTLAVAEQEMVLNGATGALYTEMSMYNAEMGGLSRY